MKMPFKTICQRQRKPKELDREIHKERRAKETENVKMKIIMKEWIMNLYAPDPKDLANWILHYQPTSWPTPNQPPSSILWDVRGKQKWRGTKMIVYVKFGTRHAYNKPQKSKGASGWGI